MLYLDQHLNKNLTMTLPILNHFLGSRWPYAHLLNKGSSKLLCLFTTWFINALNFAHITLPFPLNVDVALQWRCRSHGFIQAANSSHPFVFAILERTLRISVKTKWKKYDVKFIRLNSQATVCNTRYIYK